MRIEEFKAMARPILAHVSIIALIWFYTLAVFGNEIPVEINGFWTPVLGYFGTRELEKRHDRKIEDSALSNN